MSTWDRDPYADHDPFRLHVFVPALMSAGLLFSLLALARDAVAARRHRGRTRRTTIAAATLAARVEGRTPTPGELGLRPRRAYPLVAVGAGLVAAYLVPGAVLNHGRAGGYVHDIAWLLAGALVVGVGAVTLAAAALATWVRWPAPPAWARRVVAVTPLGTVPGSDGSDDGETVDPALGGAVVAVGAAFALVALGVGAARRSFADADRRVLEEVATWDLPGVVRWVAVVGRTPVALAIALVVGALLLRCRVAVLAWVGTVAATFALDSALREVVERPGPSSGAVVGLADTFPSGHVAQVALLAGAVPLALRVVRPRLPVAVSALPLGAAALATATVRIHDAEAWPSDALGGGLLGLGAGLGLWWIVLHSDAHHGCPSCPWDRGVAPAASGPVVAVPSGLLGPLRLVATVWLAAALGALAWVGAHGGLPTDPDGDGAIAVLERPLQLGLLVLAALGGLLAWRLPAAGASVVAVAAGGLGLVASVAHPPWVAVGVTVAVGVPAALLWLTWQHVRSPRAVTALALLCVALLTAEGAAASRTYDHYFGPAHPTSATPDVPVDRVEWAWTGDLRTDGVTVVARLSPAEGGTEARLLVSRGPERGRVVATDRADRFGIVRLRATGLPAGTAHRWQVEVAGHPDVGRGRGRFQTAPDGPATFTLAVGACARTGSDGAVYDAIRAADPLLYLVTGDLHYANIDATDPGPFVHAFGRVLTSPAQAALARQVPVDYVWDDHDYGPNDADASAPSRDAARTAYRSAVPHPPLPSEGPIFHASTVGRVRIVVTDTRSERTERSMLGDEQLAWLLDELAAADRYGAVVWVNPDPWIAPDDTGRDDWGGYADERRTIADAVAAHDVDNLVMVAGDAHMVAIDDGTGSDYATGGGGGFPVLHAAALDRPGNVKGGPYSEGTHPGAGQLGLVHVADDGRTVRVVLEGRDWTGRTLASLSVTLG